MLYPAELRARLLNSSGSATGFDDIVLAVAAGTTQGADLGGSLETSGGVASRQGSFAL